jgi:hypothetical protein
MYISTFSSTPTLHMTWFAGESKVVHTRRALTTGFCFTRPHR